MSRAVASPRPRTIGPRMAERRRDYTIEQRAEAVELAVAIGVAEAANQLGIPRKTVASWKARAGPLAQPQHVDDEPAAEAPSWREKRKRLADGHDDDAAEFLAKARLAASTNPGHARYLMTCAGIATEKAELLGEKVAADPGDPAPTDGPRDPPDLDPASLDTLWDVELAINEIHWRRRRRIHGLEEL